VAKQDVGRVVAAIGNYFLVIASVLFGLDAFLALLSEGFGTEFLRRLSVLVIGVAIGLGMRKYGRYLQR
jgi:hypothetical protein